MVEKKLIPIEKEFRDLSAEQAFLAILDFFNKNIPDNDWEFSEKKFKDEKKKGYSIKEIKEISFGKRNNIKLYSYSDERSSININNSNFSNIKSLELKYAYEEDEEDGETVFGLLYGGGKEDEDGNFTCWVHPYFAIQIFHGDGFFKYKFSFDILDRKQFLKMFIYHLEQFILYKDDRFQEIKDYLFNDKKIEMESASIHVSIPNAFDAKGVIFKQKEMYKFNISIDIIHNKITNIDYDDGNGDYTISLNNLHSFIIEDAASPKYKHIKKDYSIIRINSKECSISMTTEHLGKVNLDLSCNIRVKYNTNDATYYLDE
ncbi:MAG: hypothetical protein QM529_07290 [Hydrotalea sp.]|nr:hypothetical protein [Hydrotalea sp.]